MNKVTPENITELKENEIFVFGSNESGIHKSGAAKIAVEKFGARLGQGMGISGQTFAIPTKNWDVDKLTIKTIECYCARFCAYALTNPKKHFLVTKVGCGLAGYKPEDIAPFFAIVVGLSNVSLPQEFIDVLKGKIDEAWIKDLLIDNDGRKNEL